MVNNYQDGKSPKRKRTKKIIGIILIVSGISLFLYAFSPLISWQIYFANYFSQQKIDSPVPFTNIISNYSDSFGKNYYDASNWYPNFDVSDKKVNYSISIPSLSLSNIKVTNADTDLTHHLVQFNSDSFPGNLGNVIIFGHSTLPQLLNQKDYKTVFSTLYKLKVGDTIDIRFENKSLKYKVEQALVVEPDDTSVLAQDFSGSTITLITCTPPGTVWKRLVIKAKLI